MGSGDLAPRVLRARGGYDITTATGKSVSAGPARARGLRFAVCERRFDLRGSCARAGATAGIAIPAHRGIAGPARARGYIRKTEGGGKLLQAIHTVLAGYIYLSDRISARIIVEIFSGKEAGGRSGIELLDDPEFEIFELLGKGLSARKIGDRLYLSTRPSTRTAPTSGKSSG